MDNEGTSCVQLFAFKVFVKFPFDMLLTATPKYLGFKYKANIFFLDRSTTSSVFSLLLRN